MHGNARSPTQFLFVQFVREAAGGHRIGAQGPWTARQSSPTISANQTNALKPKIGERTTNIPTLANRPSWLLQYLAKCQIRIPGKLKAITTARPTDRGGGKWSASDFGRMDFMDKFTALLSGQRLGYIEYAGLNYFGTEGD